MPEWRNGIRTTLKMLRGSPHAGSTPASGTFVKKQSPYGRFFGIVE